MKKQRIVALVVAIGLFLTASFSFYKMYANASERAEQEIVSSIIVDATKQDHLSKNDLLAATHIDQMKHVSKVTIPKKAFMEKLTPGTYQVAIKLEMDFKKNLDKQVTVKVVDSEGPVIHVDSPIEVEQGQALDKEKYVSAEDKVSGKVPTEDIAVIGFNSEDVGKQQVKLTAEDAYGNETEKDIEVIVKEAPKTEVAEAAPAVAEPEESVAEVAAAPVAEIPETAPVKETAPVTPVAEAAPQATQAAPQTMTNTLSFAGTTVGYTQANGSGAAPGSGAATWMGNGSTSDGAPTHFIGHNPGDFSGVMGLGVGSQITVTDSNGASRTYTVYEVIDVTDDGYNNHNLSDDVYPRMLYAGGERISLQTCITETVNRCVLAR